MQFFFGKYNGQPVENADAGYIVWVQKLLSDHVKPNKKQKELLAYINEHHSKLVETTKKLKLIELEEKAQRKAEWKMLAMLSQHIGAVGDTVFFDKALLTAAKYHEQQDFWSFSFLDGNNIFHCFSTKLVKLNLTVGDTITMTAKITKHKVFEDGSVKSSSVAYPKNIIVNAN